MFCTVYYSAHFKGGIRDPEINFLPKFIHLLGRRDRIQTHAVSL